MEGEGCRRWAILTIVHIDRARPTIAAAARQDRCAAGYAAAGKRHDKNDDESDKGDAA